ncbi:PAS domain S-box-containing protein [Desulfopila aestuarii DSM 18488]|uniref:histidine kinase n=2 Tax=Desulfopila aestuarii TaxID=231440 RepID=A0A1M7YM92_9BACT|nr:PAS domain S-box-containing protein [Desulfopila aestuarii DSM 18488]
MKRSVFLFARRFNTVPLKGANGKVSPLSGYQYRPLLSFKVKKYFAPFMEMMKIFFGRIKFLAQHTIILLVIFLLVSCATSCFSALLTTKEREWLKQHEGKITLALESNYAPFVFIDKNGKNSGLATDYLKLIQKKLDFSLQEIKFESFNNIFESAKKNEIDIVNAVTETEDRSRYLLFTKPFIEIPNVIIVKKDKYESLTVEKLQKFKVSAVKNYAITEYLSKNYSYLDMDLVPDDLTALLSVSFNRTDCTILDLATASYLIEENGITNLRVAGNVGYSIKLSIASRKDWPILNQILNKGLEAISADERISIRNKWIPIDHIIFYKSKAFWVIVVCISSIFSFCILSALLWNRALKKQILKHTNLLTSELEERRRIQEVLRQNEIDLNASQQIAHLGSWRLNVETNEVFWTEELYRMYGFDPTLPPPPYTEHINLFTPQSWELLSRSLEKTRRTGVPYELELEMLKKNGRRGWMWVRGEAVKNPKGKVIGLWGAAQDITTRKQREADLKIALEEVHLIREEELALLEASQAIIFCTTFEEAARNIFDKCAKLIGAHSGYVALLAENGQENEVLFLEAGGLPCDVDLNLPMPIRGLREVAYRTNNVVYDNHFADSQWADYMPEGHVQLKNVLFAPIVVDNKTLGLIGIANKPEAFTERDAKIAKSFGELAAVAITYVKTQDSLNKSEEKFRLAFLTSPDAINLNRLEDGVYTEINEGFTKILGYSRQDAIGKSSIELGIWKNTNDRERLVEGLQKNGIVENLEAEFVNKRGDIRIGLMSARVLDINNEKTILSITRDITDKKEIEKKLIKSEEQYREYFEENPAGSYISTPEGQLLACNREYLNIFGFKSKKDAFEMPIPQLFIKPDERVKFINKISKCHDIVNKETTLRRIDGQSIIVNENASGLFDEDGTLKHIRGFLLDISEQRRLETQIQQAQKMESIGTLAGGIAHDFNNILGGILGYAEMAQEACPAGSTVRKDLDQVVKASYRAKELVKQILAFSRQDETDQIPLQPEVIIKEALKLLRSSLPTTIDIQQNIDTESWPILADPTKIHQIITNLCTNAFHAMEETGGTLTISLKNTTLTRAELKSEPHVHPGHFVEITVGDTGPGIAPEIMDKIFDPFFTTKEVGKGTGMGLAVIHGIVKKSNGFVSCRSSVGEGTTFYVYLPVHSDTASPEAEPTPSELTQLGAERVLFIDDDEMVAQMGKTMLERLGYRVTVETSSLEALKNVQDQPERFDLVITDQTMPGMTGSDLARRILQIRPKMPIILCTGYSNQISEEKATIYGIKGFAMKPLAKKDLAALVRNVLDGQ